MIKAPRFCSRGFLFAGMENWDALLDVHRKCTGVTIDSRKIEPGMLFFALKGEQTDGNRYAAMAIEKGAIAAVVDDPAVHKEGSTILVEDVLSAMQGLARAYRRTLDIPVIGLTGSNGKTTTKELIHAVLSRKYNTFATKGNLNNHIGVPLSLLSIPSDAEMAVIEMGANHQKEIDFLSRIAEPDYGLITNIGKAHLEGFGGLEGVKKGKSELYRFLMEKEGTIFYNTANTVLDDVVAGYEKVIRFGTEEGGQDVYRADYGVYEGFASIEVDGTLIRSNLVGAFNAGNMHAAVCIGHTFGVSLSDATEAIEAYQPDNNRSQLTRIGENWYIMDAYNANPSSMSAAISHFLQMDKQPKILVLGDMLELGEAAQEEHEKMLELAIGGDAQEVITVGALFAAADMAGVSTHFDSAEHVRQYLEAQAFKGCYFLVKGSRRMGLERIVDI